MGMCTKRNSGLLNAKQNKKNRMSIKISDTYYYENMHLRRV